MSGHTPGPWSFRQIGADGLGYIEADGRDIMHAGVSDRSASENVANAILTAAAPELLEAACQGLIAVEADIEQRERELADDGGDPATDGEMAVYLARASGIRAAVAKAQAIVVGGVE